MALYKYLGNHPNDRQNGWSEELQGVSHDKDNWFFTQKGKLWKIPVTHNLSDKITSPNPSKGILRVGIPSALSKKNYDHFGDLDCYKDYLFIPMEGNSSGQAIAVFKAADLSYVCHQVIRKNDNKCFNKLAWCAINPKDGRLYTSDKQVDDDYAAEHSPIVVFNIDFNKIRSGSSNFLTRYDAFSIRDEDGCIMFKRYMQGGCFDNSNRLHLNSGSDSQGYSNDGIQVFRLQEKVRTSTGTKIVSVSSSNASNHVCFLATCIARSRKSSSKTNKFRYEFHPGGTKYEEPEGLTCWDLNKDKRAPKIKGVFHAIMLDNDATSADDFYFKHYDLV